MALPLEFRGSDPVCILRRLLIEFSCLFKNLRRNMETVVEGLMDAPTQTVKRKHRTITSGLSLNASESVMDLVKPPDLNQARVNKCLIALVNRKAVKKDNTSVGLLHVRYFVG